MTARHHGTGKFAALGRQPRTEHKPPRKGSPPATNANAAFNESAQRQGGPAQGATPGQVVATIKVS